MRSFKSLLRRMHGALPEPVARQIDIATLSMQDTLQNWRMPARYVRAPLAGGNGEGTILYIGDRPQYKSWTQQLFGQPAQTVSLGEFTLFEVLKESQPALAADVTLCPLNPWTIPLFSREGWHIVPLHVLSSINLETPIDVLASNRDAKNELRVIRKHDYQFRELRSDEAFEEFYREMLSPMVARRHHESAFLSSMANLKQQYANEGYLLAAYLDSEWVGANLVLNGTQGTLVSANVGWRDGSDELMKKRVVSALLYELIKRAAEQGFRTLDLGSSNPFANDGPLNYKLKWGASIELPKIEYTGRVLDGARGFIAAKFNLASDAARSMLHNTPFFESHAGNLRAVGWNPAMPAAIQQKIDHGMPLLNLASASAAQASG